MRNNPSPQPRRQGGALAITLGDPAGVGPELVLRSGEFLGQLARRTPIVIVGRESHLAYYAKRFGIAPFWTKISSREREAAVEVGQASCLPKAKDHHRSHKSYYNSTGIYLIEPPLDAAEREALRGWRLRPGVLQAGNGLWAYAAVREAARLAQAGAVRGIVTCPLNKEALRMAGVPFPGHTEMLAEFAGARRFGMLFDGAGMKVALTTIHEPLRRALDLLTPERIADMIGLTAEFMAKYGIARPRIAVAGFNPHAGENGLLGREDAVLVAPAIEAARARGIDAHGPVPPDVVFYQARQGRYDAVVALYHDQGLIAVKTLAFHSAVNITMGLSWVRTSPDHGTAYDIAGRGEADPRSFQRAVRLAIRLKK